ncbi:MAG: hypothetical protein IKP58_11055 [Victivallales bacterium]|nr:hypothetical protein [Victivallales bacterium]MBR6058695.1 hypothetical protein [Victivallales bacterium]
MPLSPLESSMYPTLVRNAADLLSAKPWMSLESTDVFAVQDPDSDEVVFVQASGGVDGEPFMLTAYRGSRGLEILWELNNSPEEAFVSDLNYEVPALFFTYVTEDELDEKDREVLADLSVEGTDGYPVFRECRPGFQPNHLEEKDLRLLSHVIRQTYEVVQKLNDGSLSLEVTEGQEDEYYLRKPVETDGGLVWEDAKIDMDLDEKLPKKYPKLKRAEITTLKELPLGTRQLRMDLLVSPFTTDDSEEIPATFLFTVSDYESGDLLAARIDEPGLKLQKFRDSLLTTFNEVVVRMGERPSAVHVESYSLCDMLGDVAGKVDIEIAHHLLPPLRDAEMDAIYRRLEERGGRMSVSPGRIMF